MKQDIDLSIILPTFNEEKNISYLIPKINLEFQNIGYVNFEILVVDDNSTDNTRTVVNQFIESYSNVKLICREKNRSLPLSIYEGLLNADKNNIMWLDSDGSMDIESMTKLINAHINSITTVFIGSRFVRGGGYKGKTEYSKESSLNNIITNLSSSEDSIIATFLSLCFNKILSRYLKVNVKDLTSGFIIGNKKYFNKSMFSDCIYGEYFIKVVAGLYIQKINTLEIGYFCKPRLFGYSKTSTNMFRLVSLSKPYFLAAYKSKKLILESI